MQRGGNAYQGPPGSDSGHFLPGDPFSGAEMPRPHPPEVPLGAVTPGVQAWSGRDHSQTLAAEEGAGWRGDRPQLGSCFQAVPPGESLHLSVSGGGRGVSFRGALGVAMPDMQ